MKLILKNSSLVFQGVRTTTYHFSFEVTAGSAKNMAFTDFATTTQGQSFKFELNDPDGCLDAESGYSIAAGATFVASAHTNEETSVEINSADRISSAWTCYVGANKVLASGTITVDITLYG